VLLSLLYSVVCLLLDLVLVRARAGEARDVELLALRHEVRVLRRRTKRVLWRHGDRLIFAALSRCLPRTRWHGFPVRPETLLGWHRALVRRKWAAFGRRRGPGRPPLPDAVVELVVRLARENPRWGYQRIRGELLKLGHAVSATAVRAVLRRHRVPPAPRRAGLAWPAFLRAHAQGLLACDFFSVETVRLQTLYVLFFLEVQSRRVFVAGCTAHPTGEWVAQQARNVCWELERAGACPTLLLRDRDAKFVPASDAVFAAQGVRVVRTPIRAPRANAFAERWVRTVREDCLDWLLILSERHLQQVLGEYARHYNRARPHRSLALQTPLPRGQPAGPAEVVVQRDCLGGLIHEYEQVAA
jgi:putative transposase